MQGRDRETGASKGESTASEYDGLLTATSENASNITPGSDEPLGNGSVAHQIIGQFLRVLGEEEDCADIAKRLGAVVFAGKPTEVDLRAALFGEIDL